MFVDIETRSETFRIRLRKREKLDNGKTKTVTLFELGPFPANLTVCSPQGKKLIKSIVNFIKRFDKKVTLKEMELSDEEFVEFLNESLDASDTNAYNLGVLFLDHVFKMFDLEPLFRKFQKNTKREYNLLDYFKYLIFSQILQPGSILSYYENQKKFTRFLKMEELKEQDLYDFLSFYYENRLEIQAALFTETLKLLGKQRVHIFYYDGTNFYFEISKADPDDLDELDNVVRKGLRKYGVSKEGRNNPIVALGIIATDLGIPLLFSVFPGNEQEIGHLEEDLKRLELLLAQQDFSDRFLICADAGNYSGNLAYRIAGANLEARSLAPPENNAYIFGRGFKKTDKQTKAWALDPDGYYPISVSKQGKKAKFRKKQKATFVKSRLVKVETKVKLKDGRTVKRETWQKQIAVFSTKRRDKAMKTMMQKIDKASEIVQNPKRIKMVYKQVASKYLQAVAINPDTKEEITDLEARIDLEQVHQDMESAGLFIIATSMNEAPDGKILRIYRDKIIIEEIFKEVKNVIHLRPIYLRTPEHITAHIEIGVISIIILNMLKFLVETRTAKKISAKKIQSALTDLKAIPLSRHAYRITGNDEIIKTLSETFGLDVFKSSMLEKDLKNLFYKI